MFTLLGFAFDWFIICSIAAELVGCGIGCALLRSSGQYEDASNNDSVGIGTLVAFAICTVIALCVLGFGGYFSIGQAARWVYNNPSVVGIGAGLYLVVGMIASGIWLAGWMRRRVARFKDSRRSWLIKNGERGATAETAVPSQLKEAWQEFLKKEYTIAALGSLPPFSEYRAYLGRRIAWWSLYTINWIICDFLTDVWNKMAQLMADFAGLFKKAYEDIARSYLTELSEDAPARG
jgi:hypothetical protein